MTAVRWKLAKGRTWREKLEREHPNHGKIVPIPPSMQGRFGTGLMLIPKPLDVDAAMRRPRKGRLITQSQIRQLLVRSSEADCACPMTTGMFVRIAAEAAEEDRRAGKSRVTPYWRTVKDDGKLNPKFPDGVKAQAAQLRAEGMTIAQSRGRQLPRVADFENHLIKL